MAFFSILVDHFPLLSQHELMDFRHCISALTMLLPANKAATMIVLEVSD